MIIARGGGDKNHPETKNTNQPATRRGAEAQQGRSNDSKGNIQLGGCCSAGVATLATIAFMQQDSDIKATMTINRHCSSQ